MKNRLSDVTFIMNAPVTSFNEKYSTINKIQKIKHDYLISTIPPAALYNLLLKRLCRIALSIKISIFKTLDVYL